jgi:putative ABC transport system substrate-binding protein
MAARAQQAMPVIGYLGLQSAQGAPALAQFHRGLGELGFVEGRNVAIEYRWAEGQPDRVPAFAAELVRRQVAVIAAYNTITALPAKAATSTIPIVFMVGGDPVQSGLVTSLNRPGGNMTGVTFLTEIVEAKRLGLLGELLPTATTFGVLIHPQGPLAHRQSQALADAARTMGRRLHVLHAATAREIDTAFTTFVQQRVDALMVATAAFFGTRRSQITALAAHYRIPTIYSNRLFVHADGLISYGARTDDINRQAGNYVGRILKGEKPGDLPVVQPTRFEFIINLKAAKDLGLTIPPGILAIADEVIE